MADRLDPPKKIGLEDAERLIKLAGIMVLFLYALGLLALNGYLFSLGASDFSLVRPRFIYTGALVVGWGLLSILAPLYFISAPRKEHHLGLRRTISSYIFAFFFPFILGFAIVGFAAGRATPPVTAARIVLLVNAAAMLFGFGSFYLFKLQMRLGGSWALGSPALSS